MTGQTLNIIRTFVRAQVDDPASVMAGITWYRDAMDEITSRVEALGRAGKVPHGGITRRMLAGMTAALSPQKAWRINIRLVEDLVTTGGAGQYKVQVRKALRILDGDDPLEVLTGPKERSFFSCLDDQDSEEVCVDGHAYSVWLGERVFVSRARLRASQYGMIADSYREAAECLGLKPHQVQAATWLAHRKRHRSRGHVTDRKASGAGG